MEFDEVRGTILDILEDLHGDVDYASEENLVDDKVLDSFDMVSLASELGDEFDVKISARDFTADNFNSLDAMARMVMRPMDES
jgi:acyl carrier protein